jgi:hypothetical protein
LPSGVRIIAKVTNQHTQTSASLNVNSLGAAPIYVNGSATLTSGMLKAGNAYMFVRDTSLNGTIGVWHAIGVDPSTGGAGLTINGTGGNIVQVGTTATSITGNANIVANRVIWRTATAHTHGKFVATPVTAGTTGNAVTGNYGQTDLNAINGTFSAATNDCSAIAPASGYFWHDVWDTFYNSSVPVGHAITCRRFGDVVNMTIVFGKSGNIMEGFNHSNAFGPISSKILAKTNLKVIGKHACRISDYVGAHPGEGVYSLIRNVYIEGTSSGGEIKIISMNDRFYECTTTGAYNCYWFPIMINCTFMVTGDFGCPASYKGGSC